MDLTIEPRTFYKIGMVCFAVIFTANFLSLVMDIETLPILAVISSIGMLIFQLAMVFLFNYLLKLSEPQVMTETISSDDIDKIIKEVEKKEERKKTK